MRSAYPSSQSFFDATSDSIRAEDVDKCRSSASFSSLADLFTNPSSKSDLFPNARAPVFVPEEVRFPAKKKRECEERTSIWHEWGSGECQSENVAEESSGFTTDLIRGCKSSSPFPNLGSANISLLTEEFTFPARKKREEGSSWREERTSWQDWSTSVPSKESTVTGSSPIVGSIKDMYLSKPCTGPFNYLTSSKSSPFSSLGAPAQSASEEVFFPARKKREERSFWQESSLDGSTQPDCEVMATPRDSAPGVGGLADMYFKKAGSKCSNLFSKGAVSSTEEVVFPKRRDNADRNAWRDWTNTGHVDCDDDTVEDSFFVENSPQPTSAGTMDPDGSRCRVEGSNRFYVTENSPASECVLRYSVLDSGAASMQSLSSEVQIRETVSGPRNGLVRNVDESGCPDQRGERTVDREEFSDATEDIWSEADDEQRSECPNSMSEQSRRSTVKYPPPLRSLSRQGQSHVPNHMPWVQLQPFRSEGRFVLQEVKVTQPVVFQPIRKEGRLVLQLIGQEKSLQKGDARARHHGDGLVADKNLHLVPVKVGSNDSVTVKTQAKVAAEKPNERQALDQPKRRDETSRKKSSKFGPAGGALAESEKRKKSAKVWPVVCTPWEALPGGTDESATDVWDRKFDFRELCYMAKEIISSDRRGPEQERTVALEGSLIPNRSPPWRHGKLSPEGGKFDARKSLHSVSQVRNAADRLGQKGNVITIHRPRENAPLRLHFQTLPRTASLRNGFSGLNGPRVDGEVNLTRSKSIRSSFLSDFAAVDPGKEEKASDSGRGRAYESRPRLSVYQGIIRDSVLSLATAHSFLRSLGTRADIPGEPDPRLTNCKPSVASVFSCAEGVGNRHHEKNFWEQQPCVS